MPSQDNEQGACPYHQEKKASNTTPPPPPSSSTSSSTWWPFGGNNAKGDIHPVVATSTPPSECPYHEGKPTVNSDKEAEGSSSWFPWFGASTSKPGPEIEPSQCPVIRANASDDGEGPLNPLTNMPFASRLQQSVTNMSPEEAKAVDALDKTRVVSSIPRTTPDSGKQGEGDSKWVYPSPYMFYNAMKRKGTANPDDIPDVASCVQVHNFLNERVWTEILKWESMRHDDTSRPELKRFRGRPTELSPKARLLTTFLGIPEPYDRHDWVVNRGGKDVRYVIDYYEDPDEKEDDLPKFISDVRPALDSFSACYDRFRVFTNQKFGWFEGTPSFESTFYHETD